MNCMLGQDQTICIDSTNDAHASIDVGMRGERIVLKRGGQEVEITSQKENLNFSNFFIMVVSSHEPEIHASWTKLCLALCHDLVIDTNCLTWAVNNLTEN